MEAAQDMDDDPLSCMSPIPSIQGSMDKLHEMGHNSFTGTIRAMTKFGIASNANIAAMNKAATSTYTGNSRTQSILVLLSTVDWRAIPVTLFTIQAVSPSLEVNMASAVCRYAIPVQARVHRILSCEGGGQGQRELDYGLHPQRKDRSACCKVQAPNADRDAGRPQADIRFAEMEAGGPPQRTTVLVVPGPAALLSGS